MTIMEQTGFLSNFWWATFASDYSVSIFIVVSGVVMILKVWAVLKPGVKTDAVTELISGWVYGLPGARRKEDFEHKNL